MSDVLFTKNISLRTYAEAIELIEATPGELCDAIVSQYTIITIGHLNVSPANPAPEVVRVSSTITGATRHTDGRISGYSQFTTTTLWRTATGLIALTHEGPTDAGGRPCDPAADQDLRSPADRIDELLFSSCGDYKQDQALIASRISGGALGPDDTAQIAVLARSIHDHFGGLPDLREHTPLFDPDHRDVIAPAQDYEITDLDVDVLMPWINADNAAQVARNLFGEANYRKSLARHVTRLEPATLTFYAMFTDLVPIDHIDTALGDLQFYAVGEYLTAHDRLLVARLLTGVPAQVLSRFLRGTKQGNDPMALVTALRDGARTMHRNAVAPARVAECIELQGHRELRSPAHLEALISRIPASPQAQAREHAAWLKSMAPALYRQLHTVNIDRATADLQPLSFQDWTDPVVRDEEAQRSATAYNDELERQRAAQAEEKIAGRRAINAQRTAWLDELAPKLHDMVITPPARVGPPMTVTVATRSDQLTDWSMIMGNCIDSYTSSLGMAIMAAVTTTDPATGESKLLLNFEIVYERGLVQMLAARNKPADAIGGDRAQAVLDALLQAGVSISRGHVNGIGTLLLPAPDVVEPTNN